MPAVINTPERIDEDEYETPILTPHGLTIEQPQPRRIRPGFVRTLAHGITKHLTYTPRTSQGPTRSSHRPFETSVDRVRT